MRELGLPSSAPAVPAVVQMRLIGPPKAVGKASAELGAKFGPLWQAGGTKRSRHSNSDVCMYGTLIVPVEG